MNLETPVRLETPRVSAPAPVRARTTGAPQASGTGRKTTARATSDQGARSAVLHIGTRAVQLARGTQELTEPNVTPTANTANGTHVPDAAFLASAIPPAPQGSGSAAPEDDASPDHTVEEQGAPSSSDLEKFRERDAEVRAKERTHQQLAGPYAGNSQFDYQTGPDGQRYAVSGSTAVDVEPVANNPEATLHKMEVVQQAAGAPANAADGNRQLALLTAQRAGQARAQLAARRYADAQRLAPPASSENG
jgi:hypothetical protein